MKLPTYILSTLFVAAFIFSHSQTAHAQQSRNITLGGYNKNPKVATSASGFVTVELKKDTLRVSGDFENLKNNYSGAFIMVDIRGQGGNQLFRLKAQLNEERTGGTFKAEENTFKLSETQKQLLKEGALYISVASYDHQSGEIRGDIPKMG